MTSSIAARPMWRKAVATWAATSFLILGGGMATTSAAHADDGHDGHDGHEGGDACEFFLEHMWANEDGIPLLGSFAHLNEYHTDPVYENLVLSLASGAIGNSEMPIIDIYGGPLGWIPVFNPEHVKAHETDYVTLLTSCGGIGIPLDSNDLTTLNLPSVEELTDLSELIIPGLPSPEMLTDPDYLWETTDASAILNRITPETLLNLEEYVGFAGDHFDAWRLLWETALEAVTSGNPTDILEVLEITENVNTLESLADIVGEDALGEILGEDALDDLLGTADLESLLELNDLLDETGLGDLLEGGDLDGLLELEGLLGEDGLEGLLELDGLDDLLELDGLDGLDGLLELDGLDDLLELDGLDGLLELEGLLEDGGLDELLGGLELDELLGGDLLGGLLGGGDGGASTTIQYSVVLAGAESSGLGQCDATLEDDSLSVNCLYAGMDSEVTTVTLHTEEGDLELTASGGTSGAAGGSFELTAEQVAALEGSAPAATVTITGEAGDEIGGDLEPCSCD